MLLQNPEEVEVEQNKIPGNSVQISNPQNQVPLPDGLEVDQKQTDFQKSQLPLPIVVDKGQPKKSGVKEKFRQIQQPLPEVVYKGHVENIDEEKSAFNFKSPSLNQRGGRGQNKSEVLANIFGNEDLSDVESIKTWSDGEIKCSKKLPPQDSNAEIRYQNWVKSQKEKSKSPSKNVKVRMIRDKAPKEMGGGQSLALMTATRATGSRATSSPMQPGSIRARGTQPECQHP
jgi:hypothetical protein